MKNTKQMKIFTEAGNKIGYGHMIRCLSLYNEAEKQGIAVSLVLAGKQISSSYLEGKNVVLADWQTTAFIDENVGEETYCIVDSYLADLAIYEAISKRCKKALFLDDFNRLEYPEGYVLKPLLQETKTNERELIGQEYILLRESFQTLPPRTMTNQVQNVLVMMGGTDAMGIMPMISKVLSTAYPQLIFHVIVGNKPPEELSQIENLSFYWQLEAEEIKDLMQQADVAVCAAGQTIFELIATTLPFLAIKVAENQTNNVASLKKRFEQIQVLDGGNVTKKDLLFSFEELLSPAYRKSYFQSFKGQIDGLGARRAVLRLVGEDDE